MMMMMKLLLLLFCNDTWTMDVFSRYKEYSLAV